MYKIIGADGKEYGPVSAEQLRQWLNEGRVNQQTRVLAEGVTDWQKLGEIAEFAASATPSTPPLSSINYASQADIPNYLTQAILVTLCCCLPFGIPSIVYASQVKTKLSVGDVAGAQASSRNAKLWCWISFGLGLVVTVGYIVIHVLAAMAGVSSR